jgi:hypothetical protein
MAETYGLQIHFAASLHRELHHGWSGCWPWIKSRTFARSRIRRAPGMDGLTLDVKGYVTGKLHGWSGATKAIANRLWAELNVA